MKCPHCSVSLSEHKGGRLVCHYCGYEEPSVKRCPVCKSPYISGFRAGTQQIEEKLKELYPQARVLRMDADTTKKKESYEKILAAFAGGEADILIGTQMIVVIQTYQPENAAIVHAAAQDYRGFYEEEILYRELLRYPPVCNMMAVQIFAEEEESGAALAKRLAERAARFRDESAQADKRLCVIGPAPAAVGRVNDIFRFVFYVKYENYDKLIEIKDMLEEETAAMQLKNELLQIDFNPVNAF